MLQAGGVLALMRRGAQGRSGQAARRWPGPQLAERARRAKPDPQHGLAGIQRELLHGWVVLGSLRVNERLHPAEVCGTSHVRRAVHRGQVH